MVSKVTCRIPFKCYNTTSSNFLFFFTEVDLDHNLKISVQEAASFVAAYMVRQTATLHAQKQQWDDGRILAESLQKDIEQLRIAQFEAKSDRTQSMGTLNAKARYRVQEGGGDACSIEEGVPADEWMMYKMSYTIEDTEAAPDSRAQANIERNANRAFSLEGLVNLLQEHFALVADLIVHASELSAEGATVFTPTAGSKFHLLNAMAATMDDHEVTVEEAINFTSALFFDEAAEVLAKEALAALPGFVGDFSLQLKQLPQIYQPFVHKAVAALAALDNQAPSQFKSVIDQTKPLRDVLTKFLLFADANAEVWRKICKFTADFVLQMQNFPEVFPPFVDSAADLVATMSTARNAGDEWASPLLELLAHVQTAVRDKQSIRFSAVFRKMARTVSLKHTLATFTHAVTFGYLNVVGDTREVTAALYAASDLMEHMEELHGGENEDLPGFAAAANVLAAALEGAAKDTATPAEWASSTAKMIRFAGSRYPTHISALGRCIQSGLSASSACQEDATADGMSAVVELGFVVANAVGIASASTSASVEAANVAFAFSGAFLYSEDELSRILKRKDANNVAFLTTVQGWFEGLAKSLLPMSIKTPRAGSVAVGSPTADRIATVRRAVLTGYQGGVVMEGRLVWLPLLAIARLVDTVRGAHPRSQTSGDGAGSNLPPMLAFFSQVSDDVQQTIFCGGNAPGEDPSGDCTGPSAPFRPESFWQLTEEEATRWSTATDCIEAVFTTFDLPREMLSAATAAVASAKELIRTSTKPFVGSVSDEALILKAGLQAIVSMVAAVKLTPPGNAVNGGALHRVKLLPYESAKSELGMNSVIKAVLKDRFDFALLNALASAAEAAADANGDGKIDAADADALFKHLESSNIGTGLASPCPLFVDAIAWIVNGANDPESPVRTFLLHAVMDAFAGGGGSVTGDYKIVDPEDTKPDNWVDEKLVVDPNAEQPADWDEEFDDKWEAPIINNPDYIGEWSAKRIDNPGTMGILAELAAFSGCAALGAFIDVSMCDLYEELNDGLVLEGTKGNFIRESSTLEYFIGRTCSTRWYRGKGPTEGAPAQIE